MKAIPQRNQIVGLLVDVLTSPGGLALPETQGTKYTSFVLIESVGPEVVAYKPGQVVVPKINNNIIVRDGFQRTVFEDTAVVVVMEGVMLEYCSVGGASPGSVTSPVDKSNGHGEVRGELA